MADTLRASSTGLKLVDLARRQKGWSKSSDVWVELAFTSKSTLKRFLGRAAVQQDTFINICKAVGVSWEEVVEEAELPEYADRKYIALIKQGVSDWNQWRESHPHVRVDLNGVDLRGVNLKGVNFRDASLKGADLREANLSHAILVEANLMNANLSHADLSNADLSRTQALATNFTEAKLTGACLDDWNYNSAARLDEVICDYIFLKPGQQERRPSSGNFAPGDFTRLFQKAVETIDLIFRDGIDWQSFAASFQQLREEQKLKVEGGESLLSIRAIESRDDGSFVIRVNAPAQLDKAEIEESFKRKYARVLKAREQAFRRELKAKDEQIAIHRQHNTSLERIVNTLVRRPIEIRNISEETSGSTYNLSIDTSGGNFGIGHIAGGDINTKTMSKVGGVINEAQTNLVEAAAEIQKLLKQLEQTNSTSTNAEKMVVVAEAVDQIESNPTLKARVVNALKTGGTEALKEAIDHPLVNILATTIEDWREED